MNSTAARNMHASSLSSISQKLKHTPASTAENVVHSSFNSNADNISQEIVGFVGETFSWITLIEWFVPYKVKLSWFSKFLLLQNR